MPLNKHFQNILSLSFKYNANANMLRYLSKFLNRKVTFVDRLLKIIEVMFVIFGICINYKVYVKFRNNVPKLVHLTNFEFNCNLWCNCSCLYYTIMK